MSDAHPRLSHRLSVVWFTDLVGYQRALRPGSGRAVALVHSVNQTMDTMREAGMSFAHARPRLEGPSATQSGSSRIHEIKRKVGLA